MQDIPMEKSGNNIIQKIDYNALSKQFVEYFYGTWSSDPTQFVPSGLFTDYSRMNIDGTIFASINIIHKLLEIQQGENADAQHRLAQATHSRCLSTEQPPMMVIETKLDYYCYLAYY